MSYKNKDGRQNKVMEINWEQEKVLSNPLRSRLVALLYEQPMTPKQAADTVGKNPGTVYYHIQQLLKHDILEVVDINTDQGIVERYYQAKALSFRNPEKVSPEGLIDHKKAHIYLSDKLLDQFNKDMEKLLYNYGELSFNEKDQESQSPYLVEFLVKEYDGESE